MNKLLVTLIAGLFASAAFAQAPTPGATNTPAAPAKAVKADVKAVKPVIKADTAPVAVPSQGEAVKTTTSHHATDKTHHAVSHPAAKTHPVQAKADTKAIAPK